jgi:hypothetical protein
VGVEFVVFVFSAFVRLRAFVVQPCALLCGCVVQMLPFGRDFDFGARMVN